MHGEHPASLIAKLALLGLLLVGTSACGFLFIHAPPEGHEQMDYFTCTEGRVGPTLDIGLAMLYAAGVIMVAADPDLGASGALIYGISLTVVFGASGIVGFDKTEKCSAAKQAWGERQSQEPPEAIRGPWSVMPSLRPDSTQGVDQVFW